MAGTNTLAYYKQLEITDIKSFVTLGPGVKITKINFLHRPNKLECLFLASLTSVM
jgi:hypothetical protein